MTDSTPAQPMRVLIPVVAPERVRFLLPVAKALRELGAESIVLAGLAGVEPEQSLSRGAAQARHLRGELTSLATQSPSLFTVDPKVRVSHGLLNDLAYLIEKHRCDTVLLRLSDDAQQALNLPVDQVLSRVACRVILVYGEQPEEPSRLWLASRGGEHASHAAQVAMAMHRTYHSSVQLVHAAPAHGSDEPHPELFRELEYAREIKLRGSLVDLVDTLLTELKPSDLLVLGAAAHSPGVASLGERTRAILNTVRHPAIIAYAPHELDMPIVRKSTRPLSERVDKWFAENTYHADEFNDLGWLLSLKEQQGLTISLGLPALNEEQTIGKVITTVRDALMESCPLLDEIVVIDSNSTDSTVEVAESLGVPVYRHPEILPEVGSHAGKGEALWKSLDVLRGDIVVWIDTDIVNIHPRFVYGLLGPLLLSPQVMYVKGFYRRPLKVGEKLQAGGGGRVTELVARPMLNLFFPELSGIVQPLSGEYAGRREALERVPFYSGYAVETGLLIDILGQYGLSAIAQVDLKERIHHNQSLIALSKMSNVIIQAIFERLSDHQMIRMIGDPSRSMKLIADDDSGHLYLDIEELGDVERPPIATIAGYRARRSIAQSATSESGLVKGVQAASNDH